MKKIMFSDEFQLTKAVLEGRKTMTRRVIPAKAIEYILGEFKQEYFEGTLDVFDSDKKYIEQYYLVEKRGKCFRPGDIVAVAQKYKDMMPYLADSFRQPSSNYMMDKPGYNNKMFVRADHMPHQIRITNVRVERLQEISDEDCIREGVFLDKTAPSCYQPFYTFPGSIDYDTPVGYKTPRDAFAVLIDRISGKGTWEKNPWVLAYEFKN